MRQLVGMGFAESGTVDNALDVRLCGRTLAISANKADAQHIRHQEDIRFSNAKRRPVRAVWQAA